MLEKCRFDAAEEHVATVGVLADRVTESQRERDAAQSKLAQVTASLKEANEQLENARNELNARTERVRDAQSLLTSVMQADNAKSRKLGTLETEIKGLTAARDAIKQELTETHSQLRAARIEIQNLGAKFRDSVPRFEHEMLISEHEMYRTRFDEQQNAFRKLGETLLEQQQKHEEAMRDAERRHLERLKHTMPDWEYITRRCVGNLDSIRALCRGMNCNEALVTISQMLLRVEGQNAVGFVVNITGTSAQAANNLANPAAGAAPGVDTAGQPLTPQQQQLLMQQQMQQQQQKQQQQIALLATSSAKRRGGEIGVAGNDDMMLAQKSSAEERATYFVGQGTGPTVPVHLRCVGRVQHRLLSQRACVAILREMWVEKARHDVLQAACGNEPPTRMLNYFHLYLTKKFVVPEVVIEWSYNIIEACRQYRNVNVDCYAMIKIIEDKFDDEVYYHIKSAVVALREVFLALLKSAENSRRQLSERASSNMLNPDFEEENGADSGKMPSAEDANAVENKGEPGTISKASFVAAVREKLRYKSPRQLQELEAAINADQEGELLTYSRIFAAFNAEYAAICPWKNVTRNSEDPRLDEFCDLSSAECGGVFTHTVQIQEAEDRAAYLRQFDALLTEYHGSAVSALTSTDYLRLLCRFDVDKRKTDALAYVARGFGVPPEALRTRDTMVVSRFLANLSRGVLRRG